jgi:truncated hemoglobin YjbI
MDKKLLEDGRKMFEKHAENSKIEEALFNEFLTKFPNEADKESEEYKKEREILFEKIEKLANDNLTRSTEMCDRFKEARKE